MGRPRSRRGLAAACALALVAVLAVLGSTGALQRSAAGRALERAHAHRLLELAADSALEEACARLERQLPDVPAPGPAPRDLASFVEWPVVLTPSRTRASAAAERIEVGDVTATSSRWSLQTALEPGRGRWCREVGIIELAVSVRIAWSSGTLGRRFVARRYAATSVGEGGRLRVSIQPVDLLLEIEEA